ncbi:hypothetical protein BDL97_14G046300 [Sphagnum fallax]|nr:hypothetical protein BDL97_14G046300 [Sphagnum fallax]
MDLSIKRISRDGLLVCVQCRSSLKYVVMMMMMQVTQECCEYYRSEEAVGTWVLLLFFFCSFKLLEVLFELLLRQAAVPFKLSGLIVCTMICVHEMWQDVVGLRKQRNCGSYQMHND